MYVFDVKYKTFDPQFGVKREDIFQLHTYIGQYGNGGLIKDAALFIQYLKTGGMHLIWIKRMG